MQVLALGTLMLLFSCADRNPPLPKNAIPITYTYYILIEGNVDGVKGNFLLDTGADNLYLDSIFYGENKFKYNKINKYTIGGIGTSRQNIIAIGDSIDFTFAGNHYRTSDVNVLMLKSIGGDYIDGLLGTDYFFKQNVLEINYNRLYIKTYPSIDSANITGYTKIPMEFDGYNIFIPMSIAINSTTSLNGRFMLDIGFPSCILTSSTVHLHQLDKRITHKVRYYTKYAGVGGESAGYDFICDSVKIADYSFNNVTFSYSTDTAGVLESTNYYGILGGNLLERFNLIFDFSNKDLYIKPSSIFSKPFIYDRLGFTFIDRFKTRGGWIVASLTEGSEAEKVGLLCDDKILKVNGIPVQTVHYTQQKHFFDQFSEVKLELLRKDSLITKRFKLIPLL